MYVHFKASQLLEARENVSDKDTVGVSFAADWLRGGHEFSEPITEGNKRKNIILDYFRRSI